MWSGSAPSQEKLIAMLDAYPLIVFDGRRVTPHTRWEFFHLLHSENLCKTIVVGPVRDPAISAILNTPGLVPVSVLGFTAGLGPFG